MKAQIKQKLIDAIEKFNGIFTWGSTGLHPSDTVSGLPVFSVDGLLCDLYLKEKRKKWEKKEWDYYGEKHYRFHCLNHSHGVPKEVMAWAGIGFIDRLFVGEDRKERIIKLINAIPE